MLIEPANQKIVQEENKQIIRTLYRKNYFSVPSLALGILAGLTPPDWEIKILQEPGDVLMTVISVQFR